MKDFNRELGLLKNEDFIWLVYFFIIIFALVSNSLERKFYLTNDIRFRNLANKITTSILIVAFFIYLYFVLVSFGNLEFLKKNANNREVRIAFERLIAAIIFLAGGLAALYADFDSNTNNIDLAIF